MLDASVAIAALSVSDLLHARALGLIAEQVDQDFVMHAVTRAEVLVAPLRVGRVDVAETQLDELRVARAALRAIDAVALAQMRARSGLKLPDCCVLLAAEKRGAFVATFDERVAYGLPRARSRRGIDIVAIDQEALVAYEVNARLRSVRRRTRSGDLVRPRLTSSAGCRQASQQYVLTRLKAVLDRIDDDTAVDSRMLVIDLHDRVLQHLGVDDGGSLRGPQTPVIDVTEQVLDALDMMLGWLDQPLPSSNE